jgi:small GTP-binding protein
LLDKNKDKLTEKSVLFICPICNSEKELKIATSIINEAKQLTTISIQKNDICEHHFQAFVDKNFQVRGYQKVDYEIKHKKKIPAGDYKIKVIIVGDFKAGKSAIAKRFVEKNFNEIYVPTLQLEVSQKDLNLEEANVTLIIWDIGGQVLHMSPFRKQFYEDAQLALIVVDRTRKPTLKNAEKWYKDALKSIPSKIPFILVGNKSDLSEEIVISEKELKEEADKLNVTYLLTSAKTGDCINELFSNLALMFFGN